ncbi:MAG: TAXI family TRAP transporter solute-binding subunit [Planctomycetota bacterium]
MLKRGISWRIPAGAVVLSVIAFAIVWPLIPAPLPDRIRLGTGTADGQYREFGESLARRLREKGFEVDLVASEGAADNLAHLASGEVDVAFVQGGVAPADISEVRGIASLFYEPIWIFHRLGETCGLVSDLKGKRVAIGPKGSGSAPLARLLLEANGVRDGTVPIGGAEAFEALARGDVDAVMLVRAPTEQWIHELVDDGRFDLLLFERAPAYAARFNFLEVVDVPRGFVDFERDLPAKDIRLLATTANLIVRETIHPRLIPLLIDLCRDELAQGSTLARTGSFPSLDQIDLPLSQDAVRYFRTGPSWLYRFLPFQLAYTLDRLTILLIPLLTLVFPLLKGAGPLYRWTVFRRIYPWYRILQELDEAARTAETEAERAEILHQLRELQQSASAIHVPARYTGEVYALRRHIALVMGQLEERPEPPGS